MTTKTVFVLSRVGTTGEPGMTWAIAAYTKESTARQAWRAKVKKAAAEYRDLTFRVDEVDLIED